MDEVAEFERSAVVVLPSGREVRPRVHIGDDGNPVWDMTTWEVQPWNDNYWLEFDNLTDAIRCGTRPT